METAFGKTVMQDLPGFMNRDGILKNFALKLLSNFHGLLFFFYLFFFLFRLAFPSIIILYFIFLQCMPSAVEALGFFPV